MTPFAITITDSADNWAERCAYWNQSYAANQPKRKRREKRAQPLTLVGHGLSISVDRGRLIIKDGTTHFPSKPAQHVFFKGDLELPPRIVIVDGAGHITLEALDWLSEQKIDLIQLKYDGRVQSVMSASGYAADPKKVAWQMKTRSTEDARVRYGVPLIEGKVRETLHNLEHVLPVSHARTKAIETASNALEELRTSPPESIAKLLAVEGRVAGAYFFAWRALDLKWSAQTRHPIPDEWQRFFSRSSLKSHPASPANRHATHPINAMLNYAYGMLESQVRIAAIADGYDPSVGIMHDRARPDRHSFVFDQMEPHRPVVDRVVLGLVRDETFSGADFDLQSNGVCRVNPELVRRLAGAVVG